MTRSATNERARAALREFIATALWVLLITFTARAFVIQAFRIPSESMVPTLLKGDFLFVSKVDYGAQVPFTHFRLPGLHAPRRGEVVVFQWPEDPSKDFIKRCIATGGQTAEVRHKQVFVDGVPQVEPYVKHSSTSEDPAGYTPRDNYQPPTVAPGELFMMGDNRDNSNDSRFWGPVKMDLVRGRAMFIYFSTAGNDPLDAFGKVRVGRILHVIH